MKSFSILIIACVTMSTMGNSSLNTLFAEVATSEFGKTIVGSIQLQLESGATVDTLISTISDVRDGLKQQMADAEAVHEENRESCQQDLTEYQAGVAAAEASQTKFEGMGAFDQQSLDARNTELQNKNRELGDREAMAQTFADEREAENQLYENMLEEHRSVQNMLEDVRGILQARLMQDDPEFLETKTNMMMTTAAKLKSFRPKAEKGLSHGYSAMFTLLAQMLEKNPNAHGDQTVVDGIMGIIDRLEENLDMSLTLERDAERQRAADYVEISERIQGYIVQCQRQIMDLKSEISTLTDRVTSAQDKLQIAHENFEMYTQRVLDRSAECDASNASWESFFATIQDELATCGKIMYLLEDKRSLLMRYGL